MNGHVTNYLGMIPLCSDSAFYIKRKNRKLISLCGIKVDDCLNAENEEFEKLTELTMKTFDSNPCVHGCFNVFGMQTKANENFEYYSGQPYYAIILAYVPKHATLDAFRRYGALFSCVLNIRPDAAPSANISAQISSHMSRCNKSNFLNRVIKNALKTKELGLNFSKLAKGTIQLRVYFDISLACNEDVSS